MPPSPSIAAPSGAPGFLRLAFRRSEVGLVVALLVIVLFFSLASDTFLTVRNMTNVLGQASLALTAARMREDTVFRDAAHHFLRRFDKLLLALEPEASDEELVDLSNTRTARAFMLLGRVTGTFD